MRGGRTVTKATENGVARPKRPRPYRTKSSTNAETALAYCHLDALALRTERQSARMSKVKNGGLDQYGAEPFEHQQFGTAGVEGLNTYLPKKLRRHVTLTNDHTHLGAACHHRAGAKTPVPRGR